VRLELESPVRCIDGPLGELADVVIDPTRRRVTHLVVEPHPDGPACLVPIELVAHEDGRGTALSLRCTVEDARRLPLVQEFAYLRLGESPANDPDWDVGIENVLATPNYRGYGGFGPIDFEASLSMTYDRIPKSEVEIRRASEVVSADGQRLGHVDAFLVDGDDQIRHLVLEYGHLWGRREVAVPIGSVRRVVTDSVALCLTKDEVGALPATGVHPAGWVVRLFRRAGMPGLGLVWIANGRWPGGQRTARPRPYEAGTSAIDTKGSEHDSQ
jgi:sporulation protein YlmC with PRC-barrel domain